MRSMKQLLKFGKVAFAVAGAMAFSAPVFAQMDPNELASIHQRVSSLGLPPGTQIELAWAAYTGEVDLEHFVKQLSENKYGLHEKMKYYSDGSLELRDAIDPLFRSANLWERQGETIDPKMIKTIQESDAMRSCGDSLRIRMFDSGNKKNSMIRLARAHRLGLFRLDVFFKSLGVTCDTETSFRNAVTSKMVITPPQQSLPQDWTVIDQKVSSIGFQFNLSGHGGYKSTIAIAAWTGEIDLEHFEKKFRSSVTHHFDDALKEAFDSANIWEKYGVNFDPALVEQVRSSLSAISCSPKLGDVGGKDVRVARASMLELIELDTFFASLKATCDFNVALKNALVSKQAGVQPKSNDARLSEQRGKPAGSFPPSSSGVIDAQTEEDRRAL